MNQNFDPKQFVKTASETWDDKIAFDKFLEENKHLAQPFHIQGLEDVVPPQYPGELAVYEARSHHGKSTALQDAIFQAQKRIEGKPGFMVGLVSLEDTSESTANKQARKYDNPFEYQDDQFVFIGNSFRMSIEQMAQLNAGNIIRALDYGRKTKFSDSMEFSFIGIDYAQIVPPDPERRMMTNNDQKRLQMADDVKRFFHAAKYFKCPIGLASQALMKTQQSNYSSKIKIPGSADLKEAGDLFEVPDIVYAYWQPKHDHPMNSTVEEGNWTFKVDPDLIFVRIVKRRNAENMGYVGDKSIVGRIFPCHFDRGGSMIYDKKYHDKIYLKPIEDPNVTNNFTPR